MWRAAKRGYVGVVMTHSLAQLARRPMRARASQNVLIRSAAVTYGLTQLGRNSAEISLYGALAYVRVREPCVPALEPWPALWRQTPPVRYQEVKRPLASCVRIPPEASV